MNHPAFASALFLGGLMAACAASAGAEIVKCTDPAGYTVLSDQPCASDNETELLSAPADAPPADAPPAAPAEPEIRAPAAPTITLAHHPAAPQMRPPSAWAEKKAPATRPMSPDAATLRAARLKLQAQDDAWSLARQHRLTRLD